MQAPVGEGAADKGGGIQEARCGGAAYGVASELLRSSSSVAAAAAARPAAGRGAAASCGHVWALGLTLNPQPLVLNPVPDTCVARVSGAQAAGALVGACHVYARSA